MRWLQLLLFLAIDVSVSNSLSVVKGRKFHEKCSLKPTFCIPSRMKVMIDTRVLEIQPRETTAK
jgi:hypothetical protein